MTSYERTFTRAEAARDPVILASNVEGFDEAELAERAGFNVVLEVTDYSDEGDPEFIYGFWKVEIPPEVERQLMAAVWDGMDSPTGISYTLTRDTSRDGWRLTSWARDGGPWGHHELENASDAFDPEGKLLEGLAQVVFRDGRVLVRRGAKKIEMNPDRRSLTTSEKLADFQKMLNTLSRRQRKKWSERYQELRETMRVSDAIDEVRREMRGSKRSLKNRGSKPKRKLKNRLMR